LPALSILPAGGQVRVSWPIALSNFTLQFVGPLGPNNFWSNFPTPPTVTTTNIQVTDPETNGARFYRLKM